MTLKEMEAELTRLKASAEQTNKALSAKDDEITKLKAENEASESKAKASDEKSAGLEAEIQTLKATNETLSKEVTKLKEEVVKAEASASKKALDILAKSGHPAPIEGQAPKDDGKRAESTLKGRARVAAAFEADFKK